MELLGDMSSLNLRVDSVVWCANVSRDGWTDSGRFFLFQRAVPRADEMTYCPETQNPLEVIKRTPARPLSNSIVLRSRFMKTHIVFREVIYLHAYFYTLLHHIKRTGYAWHNLAAIYHQHFVESFAVW